MTTGELVLSIMAGLGGLTFIGTIISSLFQRRKVKEEAKKTGVDAAAVLTKSALDLLGAVRLEAEETRQELVATRRELTECRRELSALRRHMANVEDAIRDTGIRIPQFVWPPNGRTDVHP